jgi:hypothetical protein
MVSVERLDLGGSEVDVTGTVTEVSRSACGGVARSFHYPTVSVCKACHAGSYKDASSLLSQQEASTE